MSELTIIQRMKNSLLSGNYLFLLLEFVIVAAGIFIGFQVDRWYEKIQETEISEQYIQRLLANIEDDIVGLEAAINTAIERRESVERVILSIESDEIVVENPNRYLQDIRRSNMRNRAFISDMTYVELQSTGSMALLPVEVREELHSYYSDIGSFEQFNSSVAEIQIEGRKRFAGVLLPYQFDLVIPPPGFDELTLKYTSEEAMDAAIRLRNNQAAVDWLSDIRTSRVQEERSSLRFLTLARALKVTLEEHLR